MSSPDYIKPEDSTHSYSREEIMAALELLAERKRDITKKMQRLESMLPADTSAHKYVDGSIRHKIAVAVLIDGKQITEAAREEGTDVVNARRLLHDYCQRKNRELYNSVYRDPTLDWLRKHANEFIR